MLRYTFSQPLSCVLLFTSLHPLPLLVLPCFLSDSSPSSCLFLFLHFNFTTSPWPSTLLISSWAGWHEKWSLYPRHTEIRSRDKANELPDIGCWGIVGTIFPVVHIQDECVGIYSVLCLGNRQCPTPSRNITHIWWCPTLQAPSVPWIPLLWVDIWERVGILLSNSFNTHAHLSAAKMYTQEINGNMRIILYLSYIIADFLRSLFKRPEDVNQIDNVFLWGKVSKTSAFIIVY